MTKTRNKIAPEHLAEMASLKHWGERPDPRVAGGATVETIVDCGWGRLIFGQTFDEPKGLADAIQDEANGRRDVALYVREPHVVLSCAPQALFLDPSHTYRLDLTAWPEPQSTPSGYVVRASVPQDEATINAIYMGHQMVPLSEGYLAQDNHPGCVKCLVAEGEETGNIVGVVMGVDHAEAFDDPDNGSSLWALGVDPRAQTPGLGEGLVRALADLFQAGGRSFMDLSVIHDNHEAIALYRKLGFEQVPVYCVKKKNPINEPLYVGPAPAQELNIYAKIIVDEARRRGITVTIEDANAGFFALSLGGRSIACRESLSELTSAVAMSRCDDKSLCHRLLKRAGLRVPAQIAVRSEDEATAFLNRYGRVVVKPARGEQGRNVFADLRSQELVAHAIETVRDGCATVLMEEHVAGEDVRIIVIDGAVVAAAIRRPARVTGDGEHRIESLIEKQSRRRSAATYGESRIPLDDETEQCAKRRGYSLQDVLPEGETLQVRETANLHTGGTIHDVTPELHSALAEAAVLAATTLDIPVVGLDLMVPSITKPDYHIIEANERPGLANHEPAPTTERFVDFLFPQTSRDAGTTAAC